MSSTLLLWGGAVLILLVCLINWTVNFLIRQLCERTRENFHDHLAQEVDAALRSFREGMCEQIVLQGKKSDSLASLYALLIDLLRQGREFCASCARDEPLDQEKRMLSVAETCRLFCEKCQRERLHFSDDFSLVLEGFREVQQETMKGIERELRRKGSADWNKEREIRQSWLRLEDRITEVMDIVRKEFQRRNPASERNLLQGFQDKPAAEIISGAATPR